MIKTYVKDITKFENVEYICNAANGIGPMGAGVAGAIRRAGGTIIEKEALFTCANNNIRPGDIYVTNAGSLPYKEIVHLCTMKVPGGATSLEIVNECLQNLVKYCKKENITEIALPALGTGIGGLNIPDVAKIYIQVLKKENIIFHVVDIDARFIGYINTFLALRQ